MKCKCGCGTVTEVWTSADSNRNRGRIPGQHKNFIRGHNQRGKVWSDETREKLKNANSNENHPQWKGDDAGYQAIHVWLRKNKEKLGWCEHCSSEGYTEFANISGEYKRDIDDYYELCCSCHKIFDNHPGRRGNG